MGFLDKFDTPRPHPPQFARGEPTREVETQTEKSKTIYQVVTELPTQVLREHTLQDGTLVKFITVEEALSDIMNSE